MARQVDTIRAEFPILADGRRKKPFRHFDSACVTLRPRVVVDAIRWYYESFPGCHGRTVHALGREATGASGASSPESRAACRGGGHVAQRFRIDHLRPAAG